VNLPVVACSLPPAGLDSRLADWAEVLAGAVDRTTVTGGVQVTLPSDPVLAHRITGLVALEQQCCSFLDIALTSRASGRLVLTVTGPDDALSLVHGLLGTTA
jgi:hypothetical protein